MGKQVLPCPWCGEIPEATESTIAVYDPDGPLWWATCRTLGCLMRNRAWPLDKWNDRNVVLSDGGKEG